MFLRIILSLWFSVLVAGINFSYASAGPMHHHDKKMSFSPFVPEKSIQMSGPVSSQGWHYCPHHSQIMSGAVCKMISHSSKDSRSASKHKKCFIASSSGSFPFNTEAVALQLDTKFFAIVESDVSAVQHLFDFSDFELTDSSKAFINSPDKPPKLHT